MDEKDWSILSALFDERNITKTADRLFMSQPSLTYRLQQIENEFGVLIVQRGRQGVEFTESGEMIASYSKDMLLRLQTLKENILNQGNQVRGKLRLGITRGFAMYKLPELLRDFSHTYPKVDFFVQTGLNHSLIKSLSQQDVQIGIIRGNHHWDYERHVIAKENIAIFSAKDINIQNLPDSPRIDYITDPTLAIMIDSWWKERFSKPSRIIMKVDSLEIAKRMVINGLGYTIGPSLFFREDQELSKVILENNNGNPLLWITSLLYRKEVLELSAAHAFVDFIRKSKV